MESKSVYQQALEKVTNEIATKATIAKIAIIEIVKKNNGVVFLNNPESNGAYGVCLKAEEMLEHRVHCLRVKDNTLFGYFTSAWVREVPCEDCIRGWDETIPTWELPNDWLEISEVNEEILFLPTIFSIAQYFAVYGE